MKATISGCSISISHERESEHQPKLLWGFVYAGDVERNVNMR